MKIKYIVLLFFAFSSLTVYSIIPGSKNAEMPTDTEQSVVGNWVMKDYKYEPLTEEAKTFEIDLEDKKRAKMKYSFRENGKAFLGTEGATSFNYLQEGDNVYVWSDNDLPYSNTLTDKIKNHDHTQSFKVMIVNNDLQLVLNTPMYIITLYFTRL